MFLALGALGVAGIGFGLAIGFLANSRAAKAMRLRFAIGGCLLLAVGVGLRLLLSNITF